jgi:multimeric flavodoxin WrbA
MNTVVRKALILDGSKREDREAKMARDAVWAELERMGTLVSCNVLQDITIAPCKGCFKCWTKTPGECIINDAQREIYSDMARSDLIVLVTPVTFGGYSSELKKSLDRFILTFSLFSGNPVQRCTIRSAMAMVGGYWAWAHCPSPMRARSAYSGNWWSTIPATCIPLARAA